MRLSQNLYIVQNIINFTFKIGDKIDVTYYKDLKSLLDTIDNNNKYKSMIAIKKSLVEIWSIIKYCYINTALYVGNYL